MLALRGTFVSWETLPSLVSTRYVTDLLLRPRYFAQVFVNVYSLLSFLFLELLNDIHINTVSLQQGYSKDIAMYIEE